MAWNQPSEDKNRPPRGAAVDSRLEDMLRRWQLRLQPFGRSGAAVGLLLLAVVVWFGSGFYQIGPSERGVVQRFGRYLETVQPGWGWRWPWPLETVSTIDIGKLSSVDSKSLMLTADLALLNVGWNVQYRLTDARAYLFEVRDPDGSVRQASEAAIRTVIGRSPIATMLGGDGRRALTGDALELLQKTLDGYHAGLRVTSVNLTDMQVPDAVLNAQRDASKAAEERARATQDAQGYSNEILPKAQSSAQRQLQEAESDKAQLTAKAEGDAQRFTELATAYAAAPELTRNRIYIDTIEAVLAHAHKIIIDTKSAGTGNMLYLPLDKLLDSIRASSTSATPAPAVPARAGAGAAASDAADEEVRSRERGER
ncbi:MAG: FtsH protease activity modulator HflK [Steroidobacterales bacterium]